MARSKFRKSDEYKKLIELLGESHPADNPDVRTGFAELMEANGLNAAARLMREVKIGDLSFVATQQLFKKQIEQDDAEAVIRVVEDVLAAAGG